MDKSEFLRILEANLSDIPAEEREGAIRYYSEYIDDAGGSEAIFDELGDPAELAKNIRNEEFPSDAEAKNVSAAKGTQSVPGMIMNETSGAVWGVSSPDTSVKTSGMPVWGKILITVLTFPIWIGPVSAAFGITVALIAVSVGFLLGGTGGLVFGIVISFRNLASGLLFSGAGILLVGLGGLCGVGTFYLCKYEGIGVGKLCRQIFTNGGARK